MIFKRLYNWIKHKTLPTSFLFKNRLFLERDSKHRRIYNMFGSIFRNTKWANYELSNLKTELKTRFKFFSARVFVWMLVGLGYYFYTHFNLSDFAGAAVAFGWTCLEGLRYILGYIVWMFLFVWNTTVGWVYTYFLSLFFKSTPKKLDVAAEDFFEVYNDDFKRKHNKIIIGDFELSAFYNSWIRIINNSKKQIEFTNLFSIRLNNKLFEKKNSFVSGTYTNLFFFKASKIFCRYFETQNLKGNGANLKQTKNDSNPKLRSYEFSFMNEVNTKYYFYSEDLLCHDNWNLFSILVEVNKLNIAKNIDSNFYTTDFSFADVNFLSVNLFSIPNLELYVTNQTNSAKWNRWLYRYSILHRRLLKNSHKLTVTKRLFQSGFYDNKLGVTNTWLNHRVKKINKRSSTHLNVLFYSDFFLKTTPKNWVTSDLLNCKKFAQQEKIELLSFYEESFFWFSKRFFFFNTINSNFIRSSRFTTELSTLIETPEDLASTLNFTISKVASIPSFNLNEYILKNDAAFQTNHNFFEKTNYLVKDIYLMFDDEDFFTDESIDVFYWVSSNSSNSRFKPLYFYLDLTKMTNLNLKLNSLFNHTHALFTPDNFIKSEVFLNKDVVKFSWIF